MPLSEYEQRVLAQMEQQLRTADPKLAQSMDTRGGLDVKRLSIGIALSVLGLAILVGGAIWQQPWLGVAGFLTMLGGVMYAITRSGAVAAAKRGRQRKRSGFMDRQQDRWNQRKGGES